VGYWLRKHGLRTAQAERREAGRRAQAVARLTMTMTCLQHGETEFWMEGWGAYRCLACRRERVADRRRRVKEILVSEAGGSCRLCGYSRCLAGVTRSLAAMREEAGGCVLLCANCHAEVEAGIVRIEAAQAIGRG
jgi:hypothetical protein